MQGKFYIIPFIIALFLAGCTEKSSERSQKAVLDKMEDDYLSQINALGITDLYKEVKWRLYCNHCDVPVTSCSGMSIQGLTYGMLDMKVFYLKFDHGIGELAFTYIYNDSLQCSLANVPGNKIYGVGFQQDNEQPLYYISMGENARVSLNCDTMKDITDCPTRMINPDQPVVRKFLKNNRNKLNPWFHMEAVKRGFFED